MEEAGSLPAEQVAFREEGIPFRFVLTLHANERDRTPNEEDAAQYAEAAELEEKDFPVTADITGTITTKIPWFDSIPGKCAVSDDMEILECWSSHSNEVGLDAIREHWEAQQ